MLKHLTDEVFATIVVGAAIFFAGMCILGGAIGGRIGGYSGVWIGLGLAVTIGGILAAAFGYYLLKLAAEQEMEDRRRERGR